MDGNGKDGFNPAFTPSGGFVLDVQPLRAVSPFLRSQPVNTNTNPNPSPSISPPPPPAAAPAHPNPNPNPPQRGFAYGCGRYPVFDPAEIRKRIQQDILLTRARGNYKGFSVPGVPCAAAGAERERGGTDSIPQEPENPLNNGKNHVPAEPPLPPSAPPAMARTASMLFDSRGYVNSSKDPAACDQKPAAKGPPSVDIKPSISHIYDPRGHVNLEKFKAAGDQSSAIAATRTVKIECPLHNSPYMQPSAKSSRAAHPPQNPSPVLRAGGDKCQGSFSQSAACPLHTSIFHRRPPEFNSNVTPDYQKNIAPEAKTIRQGNAENLQNICKQSLMEASKPPKSKEEQPLLLIPKAEYSNEYAPQATGPINSNNQSLIIPKPEYGIPGPVASTSLVPASTSLVPVAADLQTINSQELRSALARSLKRFKDLTVLQPGSTHEPFSNDFSVKFETETEPDSRKRKQGRKPRPRPRPMCQNPAATGNEREMVLRALMTYHSLRRHLEEQMRRPDLKAGTILLDKGLAVNRDRRTVGAVAGVNVGDHFYFRMELCVVGVHCPTQAGIDYIGGKNSPYNEPVATSIIASGGYEDEDGGDELIYTGHGGNNYVMDRKQTVDQKLERGNFALERSKHYQVEIRVIRGIKDSGSPSGKIYIYDGLYKVQDSWLDKGRTGSGIFKYRLQRTPGQPELGSAILKNTRKWKVQPALRVGLLHEDISLRSENVPVYLVNDLDSERGPPHFEYITRLRYPDSLVRSSMCRACECIGGCNAGGNCSCVWRNDGKMPYNTNGILKKGKPLIYECGMQCKCPPSCWNRVTQKGLNIQLEVFRTRGDDSNASGWGVRSLDPIPSGTFICEYIGEIVCREGVNTYGPSNMGNEHILDPRRQGTEFGDVSHILSEEQEQQQNALAHVCPLVPSKLSFLIDASKMGNVARFMKHGNFPSANVFMQFVLNGHEDSRFPHVMLFALYNIPPLTELILDYNQQVLIQPKEEVEAGFTSTTSEYSHDVPETGFACK